MLELRDGTRKIDEQFIYSHGPTQNQTTSWLMRSWSTLEHEQASGNHKFTRLSTTQTWGKPPPSPIIVYSTPGYETGTQMSFCPWTPKWNSRNSQS